MASSYAANALAFWQGSQNVADGLSGNSGTVYAIVFLILDASFVIASSGPFIQSFAQATSAGRRILRLIEHPDIPIDVYADEGVPVDDTTFRPGNDIIFEDISFAYPARALESVLDSVNLTIKSRTSIGIVGASGSGKSTIAALLLRRYDPTQGCISIGEHSIPEYNLASLRGQIALVDQDPVLFSGTIYTNIKDGYKGAPIPDAEMRKLCEQAARDADASDFIQLLPHGLDTWLGEPSGTK
jgi:ATP-binding cassette subfamily B (MDR/TAP) protein 1